MVAVVFKIQSPSKQNALPKLEFFSEKFHFIHIFLTFSTVSECGESKKLIIFAVSSKKVEKNL